MSETSLTRTMIALVKLGAPFIEAGLEQARELGHPAMVVILYPQTLDIGEEVRVQLNTINPGEPITGRQAIDLLLKWPPGTVIGWWAV